MWHCVVLVITKGKGSFSFLFVEQIDVKHTCCASETLFQHFDPVPIDLVFSHTSIHQRDRQTAVAATVDRAVLDIPSQFRTEASQATDPVIYTLVPRSLGMPLPPIFCQKEDLKARLGAWVPVRPNFPLCSSCSATPT